MQIYNGNSGLSNLESEYSLGESLSSSFSLFFKSLVSTNSTTPANVVGWVTRLSGGFPSPQNHYKLISKYSALPLYIKRPLLITMTIKQFNPEHRIQSLVSSFSVSVDYKITTSPDSRKVKYDKTNPFHVHVLPDPSTSSG